MSQMGQRALWSREAEQSVLGAVLLDDEAVGLCIDAGLDAAHFFDVGHGLAFGAVQALVQAGSPIDVVTVVEYLEAQRQLERAHGAAYLAGLWELVPVTGNVGFYAGMVRDYAIERAALQSVQGMLQALLHDSFPDHSSRMAALYQGMASIEQHDASSGVIGVKAALRQLVDHIEAKAESGDEISGFCTGFQHVDYRTQGWQPGELIVVAGRPGMGKTAYVLNAIRNALMSKAGTAGLFFSLEMPTRQLVQRMVSAQGKIKLGLLKSGKVLELPEQCARLSSSVGQLAMAGDGRLFFNDQAGLSITELLALAKRQHRKTPLAFVAVDHIGLVESTLKTDVETLRVGQISRALKKLAKDLSIPVIALAQVNRDCEKRANKRPMTSDLRMSGAIEQDADCIQFLYRDEYYNENTSHPGVVEVISAKLRDGEVGTDYLNWSGAYNRMDGIEPPSDGRGVPGCEVC